MKSFIKRFEESVRSCWNQPALNDFRYDSITYGQLAVEIKTLHLLWEQAGLHPGDKIALNAASSSNWISLFMATVSGGYVAVPLLSGYLPTDTQRLVDHSDSRILYTERALFEKMDFEAMPQLLAAIDLRTGDLLASRGEFARLYAARREAFACRYPEGLQSDMLCFEERRFDEVCVINYTSGSTGNPKGVMLTVGNFSDQAEKLHMLLPFTAGEGYLSILPLAHIFGLTVDGIMPLCSGMHLTILTSMPIPTTVKTALRTVNPRMFFAVPLVVNKLVEHTIGEFVHSKSGAEKLADYPNNPDFCEALRSIFMAAFGSRCEMIYTGGAAIPTQIEELLALKLKVPFMTGYGMTECTPVISLGLRGDYHLKSCGRIIDGYQYRIDSSNPAHLAGELLVKGPSVFAGYYKNPEATAAAFTQDGFFRTGDLGMADAEGRLFLVGRCKSMLLSTNGQNIFPEEIEVLLNTMPYVGESLVVQRQNTLVALVVPNIDKVANDHMSAETLQEVMQHNLEELNRRLPAYSQVAEFELQHAPFAKTPKGSIKRFLYA
ncbi:MAG: AMP-binding protein [Alistipes sp.]|nr:AMP-binding protein [Alistipes sp.]